MTPNPRCSPIQLTLTVGADDSALHTEGGSGTLIFSLTNYGREEDTQTDKHTGENGSALAAECDRFPSLAQQTEEEEEKKFSKRICVEKKSL